MIRIGYTNIYNESGERIVSFNGYLDIELHDMMDDLIDTTVMILPFLIIASLYNKDRDRFVEIFLTRKDWTKYVKFM